MEFSDFFNSLIGKIKPVVRLDDITYKAGEEVYVGNGYDSIHIPTRNYTLMDIQSLINYCNQYVDPKEGAIFYTNKKIIVVEDNDRPAANIVMYNFNLSSDLSSWLSFTGGNQKEFKDFLEYRIAEVDEGVDLYKDLSALKLNATIKYNSDDANNYNVIFSTKTEKGSSNIPKMLRVSVPFFEGDEVDTTIYFRVLFNQPTEKGQQLIFRLEPLGFDKIFNQAVRDAIGTIASELKEFQIFRGEPNTN